MPTVKQWSSNHKEYLICNAADKRLKLSLDHNDVKELLKNPLFAQFLGGRIIQEDNAVILGNETYEVKLEGKLVFNFFKKQ
jgi:hypothetical protein